MEHVKFATAASVCTSSRASTLRVCLIICCIELVRELRDCFIDVRTYR